MREGQDKTFVARAENGLVDGRKAVGIELDDVGVLRLAPPQALYEGGILAKNIIVQTSQGLAHFFGQLFHGTPDFSQVAGPIGIVTLGGVAVKEGFAEVLVLAASISIALGLFNLVPIPGLDGGRLLIVIIEGIIRRPLPPKVMMGLTFAGFALVIALFIAVSYHDVAKLIG
jgi:regulator of sigma E protease